MAPPQEGERVGVSTSIYSRISNYYRSEEIIFDRNFTNRTAAAFVIRSTCLFLYRISRSLRDSCSGSIQRQGLTTQISSCFSSSRDSSPFLVMKGVPRAPITSPLRYGNSSLVDLSATCNRKCSSLTSRKVVLPCLRIDEMRPHMVSTAGEEVFSGLGGSWVYLLRNCLMVTEGRMGL